MVCSRNHQGVRYGGTYVRVHLSCLLPYSETYQSSSEDCKIEPNTLQKRSYESSKIPISEDNDMV